MPSRSVSALPRPRAAAKGNVCPLDPKPSNGCQRVGGISFIPGILRSSSSSPIWELTLTYGNPRPYGGRCDRAERQGRQGALGSGSDDQELALRLTWNDRFENAGQGDEPADRLSVLFSARELEAPKKPYFLMGDRQRPVDSWQWSAGAGTETFLARGLDAVIPRTSPVHGQGSYEDGQYRVVLRRRLEAEQDDEVGFSPGRMIPIAWNLWDGQNGEVGRQRAISRWYYLLLEPETPVTTYVWPLVVVLLSAGGEWLGLGRLRRHWANREREVSESLTGEEAHS